MGTVIDFETGAVAQLQKRVAQAEEENSDLLAFARGHSGATQDIHSAVLAAISAEGLDHLLHIVTQQWPDILGVDAVSLALYVGDTGLRADNSGMQFVERRLIENASNVTGRDSNNENLRVFWGNNVLIQGQLLGNPKGLVIVELPAVWIVNRVLLRDRNCPPHPALVFHRAFRSGTGC